MRYVTRKRPQVDRCASAWLLKRFVDADAKFAFIEEGDPLGDAVPFDMSGVELGPQCAAASGVGDEGRPLAIGLQEQMANHRKRLGSNAPVVSVAEKVPEGIR